MMKIGFIGLGTLRTAMAQRVMSLGHEVVGFNRSPTKAAALADAGLQQATTVEAVCDADIVLSVLLDDAAVQEMLVDGFPFRDNPAAIHVLVSTISVALVRELAHLHKEQGQAFVSALVFGRPDNIHAANAVIAVSGAPEAITRCHDVLASFDYVAVIGSDPGAANAVKMAGNFLMAYAVQSLREALYLAEAAGGDRQQFIDIVTSALFPTSFYQRFGGLLAAQGGNAPALNPFANSARLIAQTSRDLSVATPLADALASALDHPIT
jgi:3-hydroxyisobutyrate dehydrogenase-like beta-hydroxyacid dehydrogenase